MSLFLKGVGDLENWSFLVLKQLMKLIKKILGLQYWRTCALLPSSFGQSYKQAAMSELLGRRDVEGKATVPTPILDIHGAHGISLSTLNELARLAQKPLEV